MFKEGSEPNIYRDNLAEKLKETPKEERTDVLEQVKENSEYWEARNKKIEGRQNEEEIDDGLGVFIKKKTLYHGSIVGDIKDLEPGDGDTLGAGIYCTSQAKDAIGYAVQRSKARAVNGEKPIVYEMSVENLKMIDLRTRKNVEKVAKGLKPLLEKEIEKENVSASRKINIKKMLESIRFEHFSENNVQDLARSFGLFSKYIKDLGYDGLIAFEGGEGEQGDHDSYLIYDPEKVKIVKEQKIKKEK